MKKVLFCFVLVLSFVLPANAENFVEIMDNENVLIYIDVDSVEQRTSDGNDYIVAWLKFIPRGEDLERVLKFFQLTSVGHMSEFWAFSKDLKLMQVLTVRIYDEKDKMLDETSCEFSLDRYDEVAPETYGEWLYEQAMYYYRRNAMPEWSIFPAFR